METLSIDILNPKAKLLLKNLADLKLIRIQKAKSTTSFADLLEKLRKNSDEAPTPDEITAEVEAVRKMRYEQ